MNQFIKLYLIYPIILIVTLTFFIASLSYIDVKKTEIVNVDTYDACKEASDFKSCVLDKHEPLSRFVNCVGDLGKENQQSAEYFLRKYHQGTLSGCYEGYEIWVDSLAHYEKAAELLSQPNQFKAFIKMPGKICNPDIEVTEIGELLGGKKVTLQDGYNRCDEFGNPSDRSINFTFRHSENKFIWSEFLLFLVMFMPSSLILFLFWKNKKVIIEQFKSQQTYEWLLRTKKFRTALVLSIIWFIFFFIALFTAAEFSELNPFKESESLALWLVYLFSLYPLMALLVSYYLYSAENE